MAWKKHAARDAAAWATVRAQHGVVARFQLLGLGYTRREIEQRLHNGRLHHISNGVYAVGRRDLTPHGRWMAAVLACGDDAVLSYRSAGELWGIGREWESRIDVSIRRRSKVARSGVVVRARPKLPARSVVRRLGIPVTNPVQTLIDLATELKPMRLERAVNQADVHDLVDPETLRHSLDAYPGVPGVKTLRTMLDRHTFRLSDSDLEILFRPLARAAALPLPSRNTGYSGTKLTSGSPSTTWSSRRTAFGITGLRRSRHGWSNETRPTPQPDYGCCASPIGRSLARPPKSPTSSGGSAA